MSLFRRPDVHAALSSPTDSAPPKPPEEPRGRDFRGGRYQLMATEELFELHADQLRRLKLSYGADLATFDRDILEIVRRYGNYVNSLPASATEVFPEPGGLFQLGLEIGFYALQATDGQIFSGRETISRRRDLEPRWRHAAFIAGLCSEIHRALGRITVTNALGETWPPFLSPLGTWMHDRKCTCYSVTWIPDAQETRALGLFALREIVPAATMQSLSDGNSEIVRHLVSCVSGMPVYREPNVLERIVRRSTALVLDRDLREQAAQDGRARQSEDAARFVMDAMRRLVATDPAWHPNQQKSRVWVDATGVYMVWPNAATDVLAALQAEELVGMPITAEELFSVLLQASAVVLASDGTPTWPIQPPASRAILQALKFATPAALFDESAVGATLDMTVPLAPALASTHRTVASITSNESLDGEADTLQGSLFDRITTTSEPSIVLQAPPALKPALRPVLAEIVHTLNETADGADAIWTSEGLFIPLAAIEKRRVDPALAVRALGDAAMLVPPAHGTAKTVEREVSGELELGVMIHPRFIVRTESAPSSVAALEVSHAAPGV